jgi:multidrug efflux pump subunit AcrA (membrane-fusion protein)
MKYLVPWVLVAALLAGVYFLYSAGKQKDAELAQLRVENKELPQLRLDSEDAKKLPALNAELGRLRKDNEDLLRLRSEVGQLQTDKKQLAAQLQKAQAQFGSVQQQLGNAQQEQQRLAVQVVEQARAAQAQADAQAQSQNQAKVQAAACIANLRQIETAKQQWAVENNKPVGSLPTPADIAPYLPGKAFQLACPAGGNYALNAVGTLATCSVPGHVISP